ncbi:MAG TPA: hypothetical protein VFW69_03555, partial [Mycobacterium sp.]|nr:hypothetical protein [Mycobacterium sp.]
EKVARQEVPGPLGSTPPAPPAANVLRGNPAPQPEEAQEAPEDEPVTEKQRPSQPAPQSGPAQSGPAQPGPAGPPPSGPQTGPQPGLPLRQPGQHYTTPPPPISPYPTQQPPQTPGNGPFPRP